MSISICIATHNRLSHLKHLLGSIVDGFGSYPYEIIIADGGSTDGTVEYLRTLDKVTLIEQGELTGAVKAFNACFKLAKCDYIYWANDDFVLVPKVLIKACRLMDDRKEIALVAPKLREPTLGNLPGASLSPQFLVLSKNHIFRASVLREINYLDENFRTYFVDGDTCLAILSLGYTMIFTREVGVIHNRVQDETWTLNQQTREEREGEYYEKKWAALNSRLLEYMSSSPARKYRSKFFTFLCVQMLKPGFFRLLVGKGRSVLVPLYDYFLEQRAVFRAKEYGHLKDFYLAQRLPQKVVSPPGK